MGGHYGRYLWVSLVDMAFVLPAERIAPATATLILSFGNDRHGASGDNWSAWCRLRSRKS
jgi:hypothetical protein